MSVVSMMEGVVQKNLLQQEAVFARTSLHEKEDADRICP